MWVINMKAFFLLSLCIITLFSSTLSRKAPVRYYNFEVTEASFTRLCKNKTILTINGQFPGPTIYANQGDLIIVNVSNNANHNITIHWHGVKMPRYPWSDGPEYITQCPIRPGTSFNQRIILSDEVGTLWWHAHSEWWRATVYGALIIYPPNSIGYPFSKKNIGYPIPKKNNGYPFGKTFIQVPVPILLGEWWYADVNEVMDEFLGNGGDPNISDAFLINGQPGDLYPCSSRDTFTLTVQYGKTYMFRLINAVMNNIMFFKIANHNITVVGSDASYTKQLKSDYIAISPGQTIDFLLVANQSRGRYYMASRVYASAGNFDNTTTTGIIQYGRRFKTRPPLLPTFPEFNDTLASMNFTNQLRSLASKQFPIKDLPLNITTRLFFTLSINLVPCPPNVSCEGPFQERLLASVNNISLVAPRTDILQAFYNNSSAGVYENDFPDYPPFRYNYTEEFVPRVLWTTNNGTAVKTLEYDSNVELVFQGTNTVSGVDHPMHLHGYSFYVVGSGLGNFNISRDPLNYNLVDPPLMETIAVPRNGWTAIRFRANNPGVWFMHCHFERHISWGMGMTFIVKNGKGPNAKMLPPPPDMPKC